MVWNYDLVFLVPSMSHALNCAGGQGCSLLKQSHLPKYNTIAWENIAWMEGSGYSSCSAPPARTRQSVDSALSTITKRNLSTMLLLFAIISFSFASFARCAPSLDIWTAGGGPPSSPVPDEVSVIGAKDVQLTQFLENLEVSFFSAASTNLSNWGPEGYPNSSIGILTRIAAVSRHTFRRWAWLRPSSKKKSTWKH